MMMGFSNLHVRIPTSPIDSVAIVVLDCVVVVEVGVDGNAVTGHLVGVSVHAFVGDATNGDE